MLNIIYSGKNVPCHHKPACATSLSGCWAAEFCQMLCWTWCGPAGPSVLSAVVGTVLPRVEGAGWGCQICPALRYRHETQMRQNSEKNHLQTEKEPSGSPPSAGQFLDLPGLGTDPFTLERVTYKAVLDTSLSRDPSRGPGDPVSSFCPSLPVKPPHRRGPLVVIYTVVRMSSFIVFPPSLAVEYGMRVFAGPGNPLV